MNAKLCKCFHSFSTLIRPVNEGKSFLCCCKNATFPSPDGSFNYKRCWNLPRSLNKKTVNTTKLVYIAAATAIFCNWNMKLSIMSLFCKFTSQRLCLTFTLVSSSKHKLPLFLSELINFCKKRTSQWAINVRVRKLLMWKAFVLDSFSYSAKHKLMRNWAFYPKTIYQNRSKVDKLCSLKLFILTWSFFNKNFD